MTDEKRSRVLGMILGSVSRGQFPQREPVAFLYGHVAKEGETPTHTINGVGYVGVVAPKIPVVPEISGGFQNLLIAEDWFWGAPPYYDMYCFPDKPSTFIDLNGNTAHGFPSGAETVVLHSGINIDTGTAWNLKEETTDTYCRLPAIIWANYDVLNEDGKTLYLSASAPVPIYE
jgi:hypothetical protein